MPRDTQQQWSKRAIKALYKALPRDTEILIQDYFPYISQIRACGELAEEYALNSFETADMFRQAGFYLYDHWEHEEAETFFLQALRHFKKIPESNYMTILTLHQLGCSYYERGKLKNIAEEALTFYQKAEETWANVIHVAVRVSEADRSTIDSIVQGSLRNLITCLYNRGEKKKALELFQYLQRTSEANRESVQDASSHQEE